MSNYLSVEKRKRIFHLLCEGNGLRSITRLIGCSTATVTELQRRYSIIIDFINRRYLKDLVLQEIEADEIRTFVEKKTNIRWVYIAMDRSSRLAVHFHVGSRDANDAEIFLSGLSDRLATVSKVSTDCLLSYVTAVERTRTWCDRYSTEAIDLMRARYFCKKLGRAITNRIETHNGTVRQHVAKLGRRTRCFAKKDESLRQHLSLFFFYYNFIKINKAIKTAPVVAAGILEKPFTIDNIIEYDIMFTGKMTNNDPQTISGRVVRGTSKHIVTKDEEQLFLNDIMGIEDYKVTGKRGPYNKLKAV